MARTLATFPDRIRLLAGFLATALMVFCADGARAFDRCDALIESDFRFPSGAEGTLIDQLGFDATYEAPVQVLDYARQIIFTEQDDTGTFLPVATFTADGQPLVIVPRDFTQSVCSYALTFYLAVDNDLKLTAGASRALDAARQCGETGGRFDACAIQFGQDLRSFQRDDFANLPERSQDTAYRLFRDAMQFIVSHEVAHHLFSHHARVDSGEMPAIDAEFEADFVAILSLVTSGSAANSPIYFFNPLNLFIDAFGAGNSPDYESLTCRGNNAIDISTAFGISTVVFDQIVAGRRSTGIDTREKFVALADGMGADPVSDDIGCGRLKKDMLTTAQAEIRAMVAFLADHYDDFAASERSQEHLRPAIDYTDDALLRDFADLVARSSNLSPLLANALTLYVQRIAQEPNFEIDAAGTERFKELIRNSGSSRAYGRTLALFSYADYEEMEVPENRASIDSALAEALHYNPAMTEAWTQRAMLAFLDGRCIAGRGFAVSGFFTATREESQAQIASIFEGLDQRIKSRDPACIDL